MQSIFHDLKIFAVYGNAAQNFQTLNKIIENINGAKSLTVQQGYSRPHILPSEGHNVFDFCSSAAFVNYLKECDVVISHAGVGVITECLRLSKMPFVIARRFNNAEHVNDHQYSFVKHYADDGIFNLIETNAEFEFGVRNRLYNLNPVRDCITDLKPLRNDLMNYIASIIDEDDI